MASITEILAKAKDDGIKHVRLQFTDILGTPKNIVVPPTRLEEAMEKGIAFDASSIAGYATIEESDMIAKAIPDSYVVIPDIIEKTPTARLMCDIYNHGGRRFPGDPKYMLEKVMDRAKEKGFVYHTGPECEFFLFKTQDGVPTTIPNDSATYFDLSTRDIAEGLRAEVSQAVQQMGFEVYSAHHECAPGQHEINFAHADAVTTAERVITLRYVIKAIAMKYGLHATFMPKPVYGIAGSGMHVHQSFMTQAGENKFYDPKGKNELSPLAYNFIAGLLAHSREMCAILNSTANSFKRLVPGFEAPTYIAWANRNRSAMIRIPAERGKGTRVELRNPDGAGNPYLQFAVMLAAGLDGVDRKLNPPEAIERDIYELSADEKKKYGIEALPTSFGRSLEFMAESKLMKDVLGDHIFNHFMHLKSQEWNDYRAHVTKWEIDKYLPII
ncbi:MAG: type I glutamate--ammonia ligase [Candidatus Thermoplasmatota archaeon]|nr:type I glutamate--ammonia ligase [Candidatus Thermoplasmatota archaeon]